MDILTTLATVDRILTIAGPLVTALVDKGQQDAAQKVITSAKVALDMASTGLAGVNTYTDELKAIAAELETLHANGGLVETNFDAAADRIHDKTAKLVAAVMARRSAGAQ